MGLISLSYFVGMFIPLKIDILIAGIENSEIKRNVLGMESLDTKPDKDIVKFVKEKEIPRHALHALQSQSGIGALSWYRNSHKIEMSLL